jgi:hypothetical protein
LQQTSEGHTNYGQGREHIGTEASRHHQVVIDSDVLDDESSDDQPDDNDDRIGTDEGDVHPT